MATPDDLADAERDLAAATAEAEREREERRKRGHDSWCELRRGVGMGCTCGSADYDAECATEKVADLRREIADEEREEAERKARLPLYLEID